MTEAQQKYLHQISPDIEKGKWILVETSEGTEILDWWDHKSRDHKKLKKFVKGDIQDVNIRHGYRAKLPGGNWTFHISYNEAEKSLNRSIGIIKDDDDETYNFLHDEEE